MKNDSPLSSVVLLLLSSNLAGSPQVCNPLCHGSISPLRPAQPCNIHLLSNYISTYSWCSCWVTAHSYTAKCCTNHVSICENCSTAKCGWNGSFTDLQWFSVLWMWTASAASEKRDFAVRRCDGSDGFNNVLNGSVLMFMCIYESFRVKGEQAQSLCIQTTLLITARKSRLKLFPASDIIAHYLVLCTQVLLVHSLHLVPVWNLKNWHTSTTNFQLHTNQFHSHHMMQPNMKHVRSFVSRLLFTIVWWPFHYCVTTEFMQHKNRVVVKEALQLKRKTSTVRRTM